MAGQIRLYTANNFRRNFATAEYPDEIVLRGRDLEYFVEISPLIETLDELNGRANELVLERDWFTALPWGLIVDLLFPYELPERHRSQHELFLFRDDGNPYLNPSRNVTMDDLREVINYFLIGHPRQMNQLLLRFAYMRPGAPPRPLYAQFTVSPREEQRLLREQHRAYQQRLRNGPNNNYNYGPANNNNWPNNNNNNNENQGPELGYTEEEEEALGRLQGANVQRYFRGGKTRRAKRLNKKTRKH